MRASSHWAKALTSSDEVLINNRVLPSQTQLFRHALLDRHNPYKLNYLSLKQLMIRGRVFGKVRNIILCSGAPCNLNALTT